MDIGIPVETSNHERRVPIAPAGVLRLTRRGHRVYLQRAAGEGAHYADSEYEEAGAQLVYSAEEAFGRAEWVLKVEAPTHEEYELLTSGQTLMCFLQAVTAPRDAFQKLLELDVTAIAMELIEDEDERCPVREAISEIAGPVAIHAASDLLRSSSGGRGILLAGAAGIPPATVVVLGAGTAGTAAARTALGAGAQVLVLDHDRYRLRKIGELFWNRATTLIADRYNVAKALRFADVVIGSVGNRGARTPHVITESMVRTMKPGSVLIDLSVDQGGCSETSRPTSLEHPTYVRDGVVHYCVPNVTADVARTASQALNNTLLPYMLEVVENGLADLCRRDPGFARGIVTSGGRCFHPAIADYFDVPCADASAIFDTLGEAHVER